MNLIITISGNRIEVFGKEELNNELLVVSDRSPYFSSLVDDAPIFGENLLGFSTSPVKARFPISGKRLESSDSVLRLRLGESANERIVKISNSCQSINLQLKHGLNKVSLKTSSNMESWELRDYVFLREVNSVSTETCEHLE